MNARHLSAATAALSVSIIAADLPATDQGADPLAPWRQGVKIQAVLPDADRHTIHSYFNTCPESPDGQWVLFYSSISLNGQQGEICIRHRITGEVRVIAKGINVEDAHRAACQQWVSNGKRVVFHNEREGEWYVAAVDVESGQERVLAKDRLVCWGQPNSDLMPIYGKHWNPGAHRNLELVNVATGAIRTVVTAEAVKAAYPDWIAKAFGDKPYSIFFPELSRDSNRVYFKMAAAGNGEPRSGGASNRLGLVCYDLRAQQFLFQSNQWGHPAWHPDSRRIIEVGWTLVDSNTGKTERLKGLPPMGSGHPSGSLDGRLIVTDINMKNLGGDPNQWAIVVADARGGSHVMLHQFDNSRGAASWRRSHPHPVFSADGQRIYFNVSSGRRTQLFVAECSSITASN